MGYSLPLSAQPFRTPALQLVIGNKNYSSWSMRPWVLMRHFELPFSEINIPLFTPGYQEQLARYSPSLKVPALIEEDFSVWDSLAICEYLNENYLEGKALPAGREARGLCRAFCSEMHAGFPAIRNELPMNCRARRRLQPSAAAERECRRVDAMWKQARRRFVALGDYLFGRFSIADCMFAPVAMRFHTYGIELGEESAAYAETILNNPAVLQWRADAEAETELLPDFEVGEPLSGPDPD